MSIVKGYVLPGLPHLYLAADANPGWLKVRQAMERVRGEIEASDADVLVIYSTYWPSVIGHQIQANPNIEWVHVDEEFHALGSIPYKMKVDAQVAEAYLRTAGDLGLHARTINYRGFPVDTGSIVVNKIVNPDNRIPCVIVSSNIYADRKETLSLGRAAREAVEKCGKNAVGIVVSSLSGRLHETKIDPQDDRIYSAADHESNIRLLDLIKSGRFENSESDVNGPSKSFWWMSAFLGSNGIFAGEVLAYEPVYGTGAAVLGLTPAVGAVRTLDFQPPEMGDRI